MSMCGLFYLSFTNIHNFKNHYIYILHYSKQKRMYTCDTKIIHGCRISHIHSSLIRCCLSSDLVVTVVLFV